jgi:hypothetical protein
MSEFTIERLNVLRRGEQLVYYRGNFEHDIERCNDDNVPAYGLILLRLRDTASTLSRTGKLRLERRPYGHTNSGLFEYLATGV